MRSKLDPGRTESLLASVLANDALDPGHHLRDPGVDPRVLGLGAPDAPAHDPDLLAGAAVGAVKQRAARVTLKRHKHFNTGQRCR